MCLQVAENVFAIQWSEHYTYADVHLEGEYEFSKYNFEVADTAMLFEFFAKMQSEGHQALKAGLPLPAYDCAMLASHLFNVLDARKAISATERQNYILKIRELSKACATLYKEQEPMRQERLKYAKQNLSTLARF